MMSMRIRTRSRGFTIVETILVISLGIGMMVGGLMYYNEANASARAQSVMSTVIPAVQGARKMVSTNAGNYFVVTQVSLIEAGHIHESLDRGDHFVTPDGVPIRITTPAPFDRVVLTFLSIDRALCTRLISPSNPLVSDEMSPLAVSVNGQHVGGRGGGELCLDGQPNEVRIDYR